MLFISEVLGHGQPRQGHPHAHAGGLVHLAEDQGGLVRHAAAVHLAPQVVALPAALAYAGEHRVAVVLHGHVVDELLDEHGLAHAGAAEQADFTPLGVGLQQVDDLDARLQDLPHGPLLGEGGGLAVDAVAIHLRGDRVPAVDGLPQHVEHPAQGLFAHRHGDGLSRGGDLHPPGHALAAGQHDAPHHVVL